jgi:hypothetical protein
MLTVVAAALVPSALIRVSLASIVAFVVFWRE